MNENLNNTRNNNSRLSFIIVIIIAFFLGAAALYSMIHLFPTVFVDTITKLEKDVTITDAGIADAVEKVYDSVVVVVTYKGDTAISSGTGFVYDTDKDKAYILTNYHVIDGGNNYTVSFTNGNEETASLVGGDKYSDIAVLSVDNDYIISIAKTGNSSKTKVGDTVFAVGAPLDDAYSWSVTRGILSGKDRLVEVSLSKSNYSDFVMKVIQTDAAINSGNSGGPLSNSNGEVIGVTSMKLISSGVEGMGFAIPIETALEYASIIRSGKNIERPYLGVATYNLSQAYYIDSNSYNIIKNSDVENGVYIATVEVNGPAYNAGLREGDIIIKLNTEETSSVAYFKYILYSCKVGDTIPITVVRDGKQLNLDIKLTKSI